MTFHPARHSLTASLGAVMFTFLSMHVVSVRATPPTRAQLLPPQAPPTHTIIGTVKELYISKDFGAERDPEIYNPAACLAKIAINKVETGHGLSDAKFVHAAYLEWKGELAVHLPVWDRHSYPAPTRDSTYRVTLRREKDGEFVALYFEPLTSGKK
jgi:hypothetical protein